MKVMRQRLWPILVWARWAANPAAVSLAVISSSL